MLPNIMDYKGCCVGALSVSDIDRWNPDEIARVFGVATNVADVSTQASGSIGNLSSFMTWDSFAADAARDSLHTTRGHLHGHADLAERIATAARKAEGEVQQVKTALASLRKAVASRGFEIDAATDSVYDPHPERLEDASEDEVTEHNDELASLQGQLMRILTAADVADHDLAAAIDAADGKTSTTAGGREDPRWAPQTKDVALGTPEKVKEEDKEKPSWPTDLTVSGTAALTGAKTDILRDIWLKGLGENPTGVDKRILPWIEDIGRIKGVSRVGGAVGAITAIPAVMSDVKEGNSWTKAIVRESGGTGAAIATSAGVAEGAGVLAAAVEGTEMGAAVGSVIPGAGTVVGAVVGAGVAVGVSKIIDWAW